jgi:hypothetical protein
VIWQSCGPATPVPRKRVRTIARTTHGPANHPGERKLLVFGDSVFPQAAYVRLIKVRRLGLDEGWREQMSEGQASRAGEQGRRAGQASRAGEQEEGDRWWAGDVIDRPVVARTMIASHAR